jgi:hypothetical protein
MKKTKRAEKTTNELGLERIEAKKILQNNILHREVYWIGHMLKRNFLRHDAIDGQMKEVKGKRNKKTQLKEEAEDRK